MNTPHVEWVLDEVDDSSRARRFEDDALTWTYMWPRHLPSVESLWLTWENLNCASGYGPDSISRVVAGQKPAGVTTYLGGPAIPAESPVSSPQVQALLDWAPEASAIVEAALNQAGLIVRDESDAWAKSAIHDTHEVTVAQNATFGDLFDLAAVASVYAAAGHVEVAGEIPGLAEDSIISRTWDQAEKGLALVATGLSFGYPIESTIAWLADRSCCPCESVGPKMRDSSRSSQ